MSDDSEARHLVKSIAGAVGDAMANDPRVMAATAKDLVLAIINVARELASLSEMNFTGPLISYLPDTGTSEELAVEMVRRAYAVHRAVVATLAKN